MAELISQITKRAMASAEAGSSPVFVRERHFRLLDLSRQALERVGLLCESSHAELIGEELRSAASHLSALVGRVDVEDVLGEIFSRFCVGK